MRDTIGNVRRYYDVQAKDEWARLEHHPFEFAVTMHYLRQYLEPGSRILDVGGGPGRYAIELAATGHRVTLFDLSEQSLALARTKAQERGVKLEGACAGTATDLGAFTEDSFDAVLCFGPMYHLVDEGQRSTAVWECLRVLRPGGLLAAAFVSCFAPVLDTLNKDPNRIHESFPLLATCKGSQVRLASGDDAWTDAYLVHPEEVHSFMSGFGLEECALIGAEGFVSSNEAAILRCGEETTQAWTALAAELAETTAALGSSIHLVYFGKKP